MAFCYGTISIGSITYDQCAIYKIINCLDKIPSGNKIYWIAGCNGDSSFCHGYLSSTFPSLFTHHKS